MATGEGQLFIDIWDSLEPKDRVSFVTGFPLEDQHEPRAFYFSHVLGKGAYPKFRLYRKNIVFMSQREHFLWDHAKHQVVNNPLWKKVFELEEELKIEYRDKHYGNENKNNQ